MDNPSSPKTGSLLVSAGDIERKVPSETVTNKKKFTSAFLPDLRKAVSRSAEVFDDLEIECSICYLSINPSGSNSKKRSENLVSLACGHLACLGCTKKWFDSRPATGVKCPSCRQGSPNRRSNLLYTIRCAEDVLRAPLCLSEGGSFLKTPFSTRYFDYGTISDNIENVLLADVLHVDDSVIPEDAKELAINMGLQISTENKKVNGKTYAREKFKSGARFVLIVQTVWDKPKTTFWECAAGGPHTKFLSKVESAHVSIENGKLMPSNPAKSSDKIPRCNVPLYATKSGFGLMSNVLKKADKTSNKVWTPAIIGFGVGFLDEDMCEEFNKNLATAMASSSFEAVMARKLTSIVKMYTTPEPKPISREQSRSAVGEEVTSWESFGRSTRQ